MKRNQQAIGVERRLAGPRLADKSVYGNQTLADGIDCEEKTFESHGTQECRTVGRNKAGRSDFIAIQRQPCLCHGPYGSLSASHYDRWKKESADASLPVGQHGGARQEVCVRRGSQR